MESAGAMPELNWNSFNGMMSTEEAEIMTQFLGNYPFINDQDGDPSLEIPSTVWSGHEDTRIMAGGDDDSYYCSDTVDSSLYYLPRENSTSSLFMPTPLGGYESYYVGDSNSIPSMNDNSMSMEFYMVGDENNSSSLQLALDNVIEETVCLNSSNLNLPSEVVLPDQILQPKRKLHMPESDNAMADDNKKSENPKKKSRVQGDVQKNGKNVQSKENKIVKIADEEESNAGLNGQSSSSYCSEDDSNASQELNGVSSSSKGSAALNLNGKTRAGRGSATDPQSLYARKRRERINERLRILQNLVPNGTKVDISTMLEEAVQYVKFLQLQIKLLSSDDLWMYAPIAYNGMDIGLNLNISPR